MLSQLMAASYSDRLNSSGLPHARDGEREPVPARLLLFELFAARARQRVELRVAARLVRLPLGGDPDLLLDAVERRVERAPLDVEHLARHLPYALYDAVAVERPERERLEYQHVE